MKKKALAIGAVAIVTFSSAFFNDTIHAQTLEDVQDQQQEVKSKLSKAESKIADILYDIKDVNDEIARLQSALKANEKQLDKTENEIDGLQDDIDELNDKIEKRNAILKERMASYQEQGGHINYMDVIFGAEGFNDFISRVSAVTTITNADMELLEENEKDKQTVEEKLTEQEQLKDELEDQKDTIEVQKEQEESAKKELKEKEEEVKEEKAKLETESSDLAALEEEIRASIETPATPQVASATAESNETSTSNAASSSNSSNESSNANSSNSDSSNSNSSNGSNSSYEKKSEPKQVPYTGGGGSAIAAGKQFIGKSTYVYGAANPGAGQFDCSGFVQWAYKQEGVSLPRTASAMAGVGTKVPYSQAKPGDLVIFRGGSHVGIYLGGGKFLGSQSSTGVDIADMNSGYWKQHFDGNVRRIK